MNTMLIQLTNQKAAGLLHQLEQLDIIKVLKEDIGAAKTKLSDRFAGKMNLTDEEYNRFHQHLRDARNEWETNI